MSDIHFIRKQSRLCPCAASFLDNV
jgi:hypothetical protein